MVPRGRIERGGEGVQGRWSAGKGEAGVGLDLGRRRRWVDEEWGEEGTDGVGREEGDGGWRLGRWE